MTQVNETIRLDWIADPHTDRRLLPPSMRRGDNARRIRYYKRALRWAMGRLAPSQQEQLSLFYTDRLKKSEIARRQGVSGSAVTKSMRTGEERLRAHIELYMSIYDQLERELLEDEE